LRKAIITSRLAEDAALAAERDHRSRRARGNCGLAGADSACQARASAASLTGTYRAWLSTSGTGGVNAIARLGTGRGWVRPDGKPFADTTNDISNGHIFCPPRLDEFGHDLGQVHSCASCGSLRVPLPAW